jgi:Tol biopolymer transport system component
LGDAPGSGGAGAWSRNGWILFQTRARPQLYRVSAHGGNVEQATSLDLSRREIAHYAPQFLPDGRHFAYLVRSLQPESTGIYVGSLDSKKSNLLLKTDSYALYAEAAGKSHLLFTTGTTLMAQGLDIKDFEMVGESFPLVQHLQVTLASGLNRGSFSASNNGVLIYRTEADVPATELVWFDRHGRRLGTVGEPAVYSNPALSPDEKNLVVSRQDPQTGTRDLWLLNLDYGTSSRLTFDPTDETCISWSPDSSRIVYSASRKGVFDIYQKVVSNISKPEIFLESGDNKIVQDWSAARKFVLFTTVGGGTWVVSPDGTHSPRRMGEGRIQRSTSLEVSPDGRWVAYQYDGTVRSEIYVERLDSPGGEWQVSAAGGIEPHWSRDGRELYFIADNKLMAVQIMVNSSAFEFSTPKPLFDVKLDTVARRSRYQAGQNGQKFLINSPLETVSPVTVIVNWQSPPVTVSRNN